jgi:adenylate kinase
MMYMAAGGLVPDEIIIRIVTERITMQDCREGFILDGAPRTIVQAEALEKHGISIDAVISIEISDSTVQRRLEGRRTCPGCGAAYHIESNPPKRRGACNVCDTALIIRNDDLPETVWNRLVTFHEQIEPLKDYYNDRGILQSVNAGLGIAETTAAIFRLLGL